MESEARREFKLDTDENRTLSGEIVEEASQQQQFCGLKKNTVAQDKRISK